MTSVFCRISKLRSVEHFYTNLFAKLYIEKNLFDWKEQKWFHYSAIYYRTKKNEELILKIKSKPIQVWSGITINELAQQLSCKPDVLKSRISENEFKKFVDPMTEEIKDFSLVCEIINIFKKKYITIKSPHSNENKNEINFKQPPPKPENLIMRPPVVTIMGHVDHGKTTLLDSLRNSFIVAQEFGGITQHIGAFAVEVKPGKKIVFIDTPGHAAFTSMRSRGARITDLVILVIAADDGIMEQTRESLRIINKTNVRMIIALNKIDKVKSTALDAIKDKLLEEGIQVEDRGGDIQLVPISALKKINLDLLMDAVFLEAEIMDLKGDPKGMVEGVVIESHVENKKGNLATVLVKRGTLKKGKVLLAGKTFCRVKSIVDENKNELVEVSPSFPAQVLGWKGLPSAGDEVFEVESEKLARRIADYRIKMELKKKALEDSVVIEKKALIDKEEHLKTKLMFSSLSIMDRMKKYGEINFAKKVIEDETKPKINLIIKGDTNGTLEVLQNVLSSYTHHDECQLCIVDASVGHLKLSDVELAEAFQAKIFAFNVSTPDDVKQLVISKNIEVHNHNVLYSLIDDLKLEISEKILPVDVEETIGEAEVQQNFLINKGKKKLPVAGCKCIKGELQKDAMFKLLRQGEVIFKGKVSSMRHVKEEVLKVPKGVECGIMFEEFTLNFQPGDLIVSYKIVKASVPTSWNPGF